MTPRPLFPPRHLFPVVASALVCVSAMPPALPAQAPGPPTKITEGMEPAWTPDGSRIIMSRLEGDQRDLFTIRPDGSDLRRVTDTPESELLPTWSRDGRVACIRPTDAGIRVLVVDDPLGGDWEPRAVDAQELTPAFTEAPWAPEGDALTLVAGEYPELDIYRLPLDGGAPTPLVESPGYDGSPAWTSDGRMAFVSDRGGSRDIWVRKPGGAFRRITTDDGTEDAPAWSPDGRWIAFVSDRTGTREVFAVPSEGGSAVQLTDDGVRSGYPAWSPDGTVLVYAQVADGPRNDELTAVPVPEKLRGGGD